MRIVRTAIIAGVASLALAGAAIAARDEGKLMLVALPDGSVEHISYRGDAPPQIVLVREPVTMPIAMIDAAFGPDSMFAQMDAHMATMMRQASAMQAHMPAASGQGVVLTNSAGQPVGTMHYSYVSSSTGADGCTHTVSYSSDGAAAGQQPKVIQTNSGSCAATPAQPRVTPTAAPAPAERAQPAIIPVSAPKEAPRVKTTNI